MGESTPKRQAAGWLLRLRPAQLSVWLGSGLAGLLALFLIATRTAATAEPPSTPLDNLALYASRGQPIHYCPTGWHQHRPTSGIMTCTVISDLTPFENRKSLPQDGEFIWVEFTSENLNVDELIRLWGRPVLSREQGNRVSLQWTLDAAGLSARMFWGDPHKLPGTTILTLEALDDTGSTDLD